MKKFLYTLVASILLPVFIYAQNSCGAILLSESEYAQIPVSNFSSLIQYSPRPEVSSNQFSAIVNLVTPTPGNQGSIGSCTAWAIAYGAMSILAYDKFGQNMNNAKRSPSFVYNQTYENEEYDGGGAVTYKVLNFVSCNGSCSWNSMPYTTNFQVTPNGDQKFDGGLNTVSYGRLQDRKDVNSYRSAIYYGYPVVIAFNMSQAFYDMWNSNGIWKENYSISANEGHACCIVGYDDQKKMFKAMNSWGTSGGDNGYFWITYDLIQAGCIREAYVLSNINPCKNPTLMGAPIICDEQTYRVSDFPAGATTTWTATPYGIVRNAFSVLNCGNDCAIIKRNNNSGSGLYTGSAFIQATVTLSNNAQKTFTQTIEAKTPLKPILPTNTAASVVGKSRTFTESRYIGSENASKLEWTITYPNGSQKYLGTGNSMSFTPTSQGKYKITVEYVYGCGDTRSATAEFTAVNDYVIIHPNPTRSTLDLAVYEQVTPDGEETGDEPVMLMCDENVVQEEYVREPYMGAYVIEIANEKNGILRSFVVEENNPQIQLSLNGLSEGTYFLRLIVDGNLVKVSQLLIR